MKNEIRILLLEDSPMDVDLVRFALRQGGLSFSLQHVDNRTAFTQQLEKAARKLGHTIKIETQGAMGIENQLSQAEIDAADIAIFAADIAIEQEERFHKIRKVQVPVQSALKDPAAILQKALAI